MKTNQSSASSHHLIEALEARIAPAAVFSFTDVDGDHVTIHSSKGSNTDLSNAAHIVAGQLQLLDLSSAVFGGEFNGANLSFTVSPQGGQGDGHVNVGFIKATGNDLGQVTVPGDLGRIAAGDLASPSPAVKSLNVASMGIFGTKTQAAGGTLASDFQGALGALTVAGEVRDATFTVAGGVLGKVGAVKIGAAFNGASLEADGDIASVKIIGDLRGGSATAAGSISAGGTLGSVTIAGDLAGSLGSVSGTLVAFGKIGSVKIGGDIVGGAGPGSGQIQSFGSIGSIVVGGSVRGGSEASTGSINSLGKAGSITIGGSILGGSGNFSGSVSPGAGTGSIAIGGDLRGGDSFEAGSLLPAGAIASITIKGSVVGGSIDHTGVIDGGSIASLKIMGDLEGMNSNGMLDDVGEIAAHKLGTVTIGGSIKSGFCAFAAVRNGAIVSETTIGSLAVGGNIEGNISGTVVISAVGQAVQGATTDLAIGKITVGGVVKMANILAGYDVTTKGVNADAQIGPVTAGSWMQSNLVAGVSAGADSMFGTLDDVKLSGGKAAIVSKIASVTIKGQALGYLPGGFSNGIVAQQIGSVKIGAFAPGFTSAANEVFVLSTTVGKVPSFTAREDV